jgi:hypothetical protein
MRREFAACSRLLANLTIRELLERGAATALPAEMSGIHEMDPISVERIEATLFASGLELGDYFLVDGAPMFWGELGGVMYPWFNLVEDDGLSRACIEYLRERGVKEYANLSDVPQPP